MSSKINVFEIVCGHTKTLNNRQQKISLIDLIIFYLLPAAISGALVYLKINIDTQLLSLLVNFGAIFTALLLSVLVLVYDQEAKVDRTEDKKQSSYILKKELLSQLYYNISYSILVSLTLVIVCFIHSMCGVENKIIGIYVTTPLAVFITINLFLTIIMIVKRMHVLLTTQVK